MWVALLYSMMCRAALFNRASVTESEGVPPDYPYVDVHQEIAPSVSVQLLRERIVQCLILGRYTNPGPYTLESLLLYFATEYFLCPATEIGTFVLVGIIVRLAMRMGYHRDPSHLPSIKPLEVEMRRRVWASVFQLDLMMSAQVGLPRILKQGQSDTLEPRNIMDDDFDEHTLELPLARSDNDPTIILFIIARMRMASAFSIILDLTTSMTQPSYAQIMEADQVLSDALTGVPKCL